MKRIIAALIICLLLTGCWDQLQLKKLLFVDVVGIDYEGDSNQLDVHYVVSSLRNAHQGGGDPSNLYLHSTGSNLYDSVAKINKKMPGVLSVLETRLYLISAKFAKDQPLNHLNVTSQFLSNPLYAYLAVYDGDLSELLARKKIREQTISNYLVSLIDDEKKRGNIPSQKMLHYLLGGTEFINDFALNRFEPHENSVRLAGAALFRDGKYTGVNLNDDETLLANLMDGAPGKMQLFIGKAAANNYSILVQKARRDYDIIHDANGLREIDITLKLEVKFVEEGLEIHNRASQLAKLEAEIGADITAKASGVIATLQKVNCDYLQLGHEVAAFHPKLYQRISWREQYPKLKIKPVVKIKILNSGILE